jgi:hypothetical protein
MSDASSTGGELLPQENLIGKTLDNGRYEIVKLIGEGGMGRVFQARQISMDRMVALKVLRAQLALDDHLLARFQQEALSVSKLRHPNTITVYDYGRTHDGLLFIAMELLGGKSLYQLLRQKRRLSLHRTLHIMAQVVGAVAEAHQLGVVHRDLKPENIQIDQVGGDPYFAKVLDFGIAKIVHGEGGSMPEGKALTMAGAIFGTPAYMSPEQVHGEKVDHRTDIYSLGVILYEMLAGQQPFTGSTPMAIMMAQASKAVPPIREVCPEADVNDAILRILDRCLAKERERRYPTTVDLQRALQSVQVEIGDIARSQMLVREGQWASVTAEETPRAKAAAAASLEDAAALRPQFTPAEDEPSGLAVGQLATRPPGEDIGTPVRSGRGRTLVLGIVGLGVIGGALALWRPWESTAVAPPPEVVPDAAVIATEFVDMVDYRIESEPSGAHVFDGELSLGRTPLDQRWRRGLRKQLRFELAQHDTQTLELSGEGEATQTRLVKLTPVVVPAAPFRIQSTPPGARVSVNDAEICPTTPCRWTPPASHGSITFKAHLDKYKDATATVDARPVDAGPLDIELVLEPEKPKTVGPVPRPNGRPKAPASKPEVPATVPAAPPTAPPSDEGPYRKL